MYRCFCLLAVMAASLPAATLISSFDFNSPTIMTFGSSGIFTSPAAYTEAGASIAQSSSGETIYTYSGILDPAVISAGTMSLNVIFTFYSDAAMTNVTESYTTAFSVAGSDIFYGLKQNAGSFAAVRIGLAAATGGGSFSPTIDDFRFEAGGGTVPEPASLTLIGLGAGSLVFAWRRRAASKR